MNEIYHINLNCSSSTKKVAAFPKVELGILPPKRGGFCNQTGSFLIAFAGLEWRAVSRRLAPIASLCTLLTVCGTTVNLSKAAEEQKEGTCAGHTSLAEAGGWGASAQQFIVVWRLFFTKCQEASYCRAFWAQRNPQQFVTSSQSVHSIFSKSKISIPVEALGINYICHFY